MPNVFRSKKKPYNLRNQRKLYTTSTPKSKRHSSDKENTSYSDPPEYCAYVGLEVQDISDPDEFYNEKHLNKGGEKERGTENLTENIFATGGQQVPANTSPVGSDNVTDNALAACGQPVLVVNSPADIYKYFPWILTYEETVQEDLNSKRLKFVR
ncbi:hypothetical protein OS493_005964 [Desmophyllum pertusum]|uniref:Uncharacterized protein n=1 Tax=Desmophyllum pertusum TaxID=174260 RepID=A0A9X0CHZ2_9CNID|nr:hypothetical protein OS493_005964 [Desmophyllum pertusum]